MRLSQREFEIYTLIQQGKERKEIAEILGVTKQTLASYIWRANNRPGNRFVMVGGIRDHRPSLHEEILASVTTEPLPDVYGRTPIPKRVRAAVVATWEATGERTCALCGDPIAEGERPSLDHIVPVSAGGLNEAQNLRVVHQRCNTRRAGLYWRPQDQPFHELVLRYRSPDIGEDFSSVLHCRRCGSWTVAFIQIPGPWPSLGLCQAHQDWAIVSHLLLSLGVPAETLDGIQYVCKRPTKRTLKAFQRYLARQQKGPDGGDH